MTISSRTPEGSPNTCQICGNAVTIEPSLDSNDATCPFCGCLLWFLPDSNETDAFINVYGDMRSAAHSIASVIPDSYVIPGHILQLLPASLARENVVIPLAEKRNRLVVAFPDPLDFEKYDKLRFILNRKISVVHAEQQWIERKISECFS